MHVGISLSQKVQAASLPFSVPAAHCTYYEEKVQCLNNLVGTGKRTAQRPQQGLHSAWMQGCQPQPCTPGHKCVPHSHGMAHKYLRKVFF
jgi:hypothetical protein